MIGPGGSDGAQRVVLATPPDIDAESNYTPSIATYDGGPSWNTNVGATTREVVESADATGAGVPVTIEPETGHSLAITDLVISVDTEMSLVFQDTSMTPLRIFKVFMPANSTIQITPRGWYQLATGKQLYVVASAAGNIAVTSFYKVIPAAV